MPHSRSVWPYNHFEVLQAILWAKNILNPIWPLLLWRHKPMRPLKSPFLWLFIYTSMQNFRRIAPVTKEIEAKHTQKDILIHYDVIIKQTKHKYWTNICFRSWKNYIESVYHYVFAYKLIIFVDLMKQYNFYKLFYCDDVIMKQTKKHP